MFHKILAAAHTYQVVLPKILPPTPCFCILGQSFGVFLTQDLCRQNMVTEAFKLTPAFQKWHLCTLPVSIVFNT